jgi:hypothetical protein
MAVGPAVFEIPALLGKNESVQRLKIALSKLK